MFGIKTDESISDSLLSSYAAWDDYVAHLWYSFFNFCGAEKHSTIIEIAPGASPKIAKSLRKLEFSGQLYIVEPYVDALKIIIDKYSEILPNAKIHPIPENLTDALHYLPSGSDFIVSDLAPKNRSILK